MRINKYGMTFLALFLLIVTSIGKHTYAAQSSIESIDIHVMIHEDGSADITERRIENITEGTERYLVKEDVRKRTIENFTVTKEGETFTFHDPWNLDASFEEKAFKNGIIETKNGYELVWGITEYGTNEYVLQYTVTNLVTQLNDSQMIFWNFISDELPKGNISVQIESFKPFNKEEEAIWAFGYPGDIHFVDGKIVAQSSESLLANDQVIILVKLQNGMVVTENKVNQSFDSIQKEAFQDSDYETDAGGFSSLSTIISFISSLIVSVLKIVLIVGAIIFLGVFARRYSKQPQRQKFARKYKEQYYRDFPYEGNFLHSYYIVYYIGLADFKTLLTALLLKWIKEDNIHIETTEGGMFKKDRATITFLTDDVDSTTNEGKLFSDIKQLAGKDNHLDDRTLSKWATKNYSKLNKWERDVLRESREVLAKEGHLLVNEKKFLIFDFSSYELTATGTEICTNVYKYVNYLIDFSLLHEHEAINVKLWDEIMIWAAYMNLTDVVMKQFKQLYPNYVNESVYKEDIVRNTTAIASTTAKSRSDAEQRARSSGQGGSASRGGGSGASGGGGGGVR